MACSGNVITYPKFDGDSAIRYVIDQVNFGPRVPGSESSSNFRSYLYKHFEQLQMKIDTQKFIYFDTYTNSNIVMVNVLASFNSSNSSYSNKLLLLAHYDSRPRAENAFDSTKIYEPIDGANDGASGVAVLMEIANKIVEQSPSIDVDFLFVDGEDWGKVGDNENYLLGSKEFARQSIRDKYRFGIVVDMVGDSQQQIYREASSELFARDINDMIFTSAKRLKLTTFIDSVKYAVTDDHLSLNVAGVPSAVIIDFDYEYWHTENDTPDKCSAQSLENVGKLLLEIIYNESLWP
jgi:Zn-dependent M28 family amino/carboxypeptidase